jgi:rSAM/selenodomain-associated transferase 2
VSGPGSASLRLSVIVPAWNDHANLAQLLPGLVRLNVFHEVIVADASPNSTTAETARLAGVIYLRSPQPNRGAQMNLAAEKATGEILIFHHADSILTTAHVAALEQALRDPEIIGGAFYRKFDGRHPRLRWLEALGRFLSRHGGSLFGDQSLFVRREIFRALGGFASIPLMEDMEFSRRLRRFGQIAVLDPPLESSNRRHLVRGSWRTSVQNGIFIVLYKCGFSPVQLHRWYYRDRSSA